MQGLFQAAPSAMLCIIKCELILIFWDENLFLPACGVCGFRFSEVAHVFLQAWTGCFGCCAVFLGQRKREAMAFCRLSCLTPSGVHAASLRSLRSTNPWLV